MANHNRFPVYRGEKPFVFISYAHADSESVLPVAEELYRRNYRVWYDEGIEAGTRWPEYIANRLLSASCVLFFTSGRFGASHNCEREVNFAVDAKKSMACVWLDAEELSAGLSMQLSTAQCIPMQASPAQTVDALIATGALGDELIDDGLGGEEPPPPPPPPPPYLGLLIGIVGIVLALLTGLAFFGYTRGWFGEKSGISSDTYTISQNEDGSAKQVEVTSWNSAMMRDLLISQTEGEALYCCGNALVSARSGIDYQDGAFLLAGKPSEKGDIDSLETISKLSRLIELSLCNESITDIHALASLANLSYLDLSGNAISDISALTSLPNLAVLKLSHTQVTDLSAALDMPSLQKLYVSFDMMEDARAILGGDFELIVTE